MELSDNCDDLTSQESEVYEGEITLEINGSQDVEDNIMQEEIPNLKRKSSVEYKDESVIATQNFPLSSNKPLGTRIKSSLEYAKWSLTRYSNPNDSAFSNLKRNIWCNLKQFFFFLHFKLTEKADTTPQNRKFNFIDVYKSVEEDPHLPHHPEGENSKQRNYCLKLIQYALLEQTWLLLILLGTFCAFSAILLEFSLSSLEKGISWINDWMIDNFVFTGNLFVRLLVDIVIKLILCSIAGLIVRYVSPQAAGSGLPEMKSILSGVVLPRYLSFRTYLAKFVGLLFGIAGGLSIGMEGPFVHLSAIIANQLSKVKIFERIRKNEALRFQMLSAGCAVGISTVFGAPIGGVLFAIEKTTTYVLVQNIWKSLFAATVGALIAKLGGDSGLFAMFATSFPSNPYKLWELLPHTLIGIIFGYLGGMWVRFVLKCVLVRRDYKILSTTRYSQLLIIAALTAIVVFPFSAFQMDNNEVISTLFSTSASDIKIWNETMNIYFTLILFIAYKFVFTGISLGLPVPCGLYIPVFLIGAAGGRLIGEFLLFLFPSSGIIPGGYAVVGAAAMSSGVTRTLSTSIIVFEMTGQLELLIPVLIATILGTAVGNLFSDGIYETLLEQKRLPYMPPFGHLLLPDNMKNAAEMMKRDVISLDQKATFNQVFNLIDNYNFTSYPVVGTSEQMILCGEVSRKALVSLLESRDMIFANDIEKSFLKHFHQSSTKDQMIKHLKNRYKFASNKTDSNDVEEEDDEDYSIVEEDLYQKRYEFFNVSILEELEKLSNSDYDRSPFQVTEGTHFFKIHFMFAMLGLNHAYITRNGSLVGVITKKDFLTKTRSFIVWR